MLYMLHTCILCPSSLSLHRYAMDIALLNLANILHRSKHSEDATVPLLVAISLSPNVNVLHYTLGNIYAVSEICLM